MARPDPIQRLDSAFFWTAAERGELVVQQCQDCGAISHPPRAMCPACHSVNRGEKTISGKGRLLTWIRPVRPAAYGFDEAPIVILVELEEGIRLISNLEGTAADSIEIGMAVEVAFAATSGGKRVPIFRKAEAAA